MNWGIFYATVWSAVLDFLPEKHWWRLKLNKSFLRMMDQKIRGGPIKKLVQNGHCESFLKTVKNPKIMAKYIGQFGNKSLIRKIINESDEDTKLNIIYGLIKSGRYKEPIKDAHWTIFNAVCKSGRPKLLEIVNWEQIYEEIKINAIRYLMMDSCCKAALLGGNIEIINFIWVLFGNYNTNDEYKKKILSAAAIRGSEEAVEFLKNRGLFTPEGYCIAAYYLDRPEWLGEYIFIYFLKKSLRRGNMKILKYVYNKHGKKSIPDCPLTIEFLKLFRMTEVLEWLSQLD